VSGKAILRTENSGNPSGGLHSEFCSPDSVAGGEGARWPFPRTLALDISAKKAEFNVKWSFKVGVKATRD